MRVSDQATTVLLRTLRGNSIHLDHGTSRLMHRWPSRGDDGIRLILHGHGARIAVLNRQGPRGILIEAGDPACRLVPLEQATCFTLVEDSAGPLGLFADGAALHALADGTVRLLSGTPREGALFFALTIHAQRCSDALRESRWVDLTTGQIHPAAKEVPGHWHQLTVAGQVVGIAGTRDPFVTDAPAAAPVHCLHVVRTDGAILPLARYRPLIYFAVYGRDRYFECLALALQSMAAYGAFDGTLCIASDRGRDGVAQYVPDAFAGRWLHRDTNAQAGLFARYDCGGWGLEDFSPILYMDVDIVINAPLTPLLVPLAGSRRVHVGTSNRFAAHLTGQPWRAHASDLADWFGNWLFGHDPRLADQPFAMGNSGTIGFATIGHARQAFDLVHALRLRVREELLEYFGDQPLLNYALHVLGCGDFATLDRFIDLARDADECGEARRGIMHFHAGVGAVELKHPAMMQYMAWLEAQTRAGASGALISSDAEDATHGAFPLAI